MTYNTIKKFMFDPTKIIENEWFFFTIFNWVTKLLSGVQNPSIKLTAIQVEQAIHMLIFLLIKHFNCSLVDFSVFRQFKQFKSLIYTMDITKWTKQTNCILMFSTEANVGISIQFELKWLCFQPFNSSHIIAALGAYYWIYWIGLKWIFGSLFDKHTLSSYNLMIVSFELDTMIIQTNGRKRKSAFSVDHSCLLA